MTKHYGHEEGLWFWGCDACNPLDTDMGGARIKKELTIPDEAIEAAAEALYEHKYEHRAWDEAKSPESWRASARVALEAAFSHMSTEECL